MTVTTVYAVISTKHLDEAHAWYARLFGRASDFHPMPALHEWHFGQSGVQLVANNGGAGSSMLTIIVNDLAEARREVESRGLSMGPTSRGNFAAFAQIADLDGNQITVAQPSPGGG
jgi:predicted enzyme related to lactoylglutathione lyase